MTPIMEQYQAIKQKYPQEILFFRLGDFYEMFYDDARTASRVLGITLTARFKNQSPVPMAGVPYHVATTYINRLLKAGFKVAICEQTEPAESVRHGDLLDGTVARTGGSASGMTEGLVDRSVIRVITPGTVLEDNILNSKAPNFLCAICLNITTSQKTHSNPSLSSLNPPAPPPTLRREGMGGFIGLAWIDLSTGEFKTEEFPFDLNRLIDELRRVNPSECLIPEYLTIQNPQIMDSIKNNIQTTFTPFSDWAFEYASAYKTLIEHFQTTNLAGFGCDNIYQGICASGAILQYLYQTQMAPKRHSDEGATPHPLGLSPSLKYITKLERYSSENRLYLDRTTHVSLELLSTISSQRYGMNTLASLQRPLRLGGDEARERSGQEETGYGSLLWVLDKTQTAMGARMLRDWVLSPLKDVPEILSRQGGIAAFVKEMTRRKELQKELKECVDIERVSAKIGSGRANARDMVGLKKTLQRLPFINVELRAYSVPMDIGMLYALCSKLDPLEALQKLIGRAIADDPPLDLTEGGIIKDGYNSELDHLRNICKEGMNFITHFQAEEIKRTGINSLKVGYNQVFGYYIEVTNVHQSKIPLNYIRKQTLKNAERYITPELKDYETQVLHAKERSQKLEYEIFSQVRKEAAIWTIQLQNIAGAIATLDCLLSLAQVASENNYCAPIVDDSLLIKITEGRHPVLEKVLDEKFIPNDICLDKGGGDEDQRIIILTGPNMSGKSTYIRQVALIVLMAQMGSFVPAKEATIGVVDRIFTRVGASDELTRGSSTFMVEMNETANILNNATNRSLIILDEVGRGTSTFDGVSIAWAVTEYLHDHSGSRTLFATHYHELTELALVLPGVRNYHISVREWGDKIIFTRKIIPGGTDKSYGIQVARLAGLPQETLKRARQILNQLEKQVFDIQGKPLLDGGAHKLMGPDNTIPFPRPAGRGSPPKGAAS
ncbi:MAG: DNA mismatch repair protein MutS, partial [Planctomycetota bacterium]|nr:DNA mismatch repair protein MutS [Planctomycetota bacterium]